MSAAKLFAMSYKAFVFDLDGTLIDSRLDFARLRQELGISPGTPILEEVAEWPEDKQKWAQAVLDDHEITGVSSSDLFPGVSEFLSTLAEKNIPVALFTRNSRKATEIALARHGLKFSAVITRDDAPAKPHPAGLLRIAEHLGLATHEILYVGDYLYDLKAGSAAQMPTALFTSGPMDFDTAGALFMFRTFLELHTHCALEK